MIIIDFFKKYIIFLRQGEKLKKKLCNIELLSEELYRQSEE